MKEDIGFLEQHIKTAIDFIFTVSQLAHSNEWRITEKERKTQWWQLEPQLLRVYSIQ